MTLEYLREYRTYCHIDATESSIERPKKAKAVLFGKEKEAYVKNSGGSKQENTESNMYGFFKR